MSTPTLDRLTPMLLTKQQTTAFDDPEWLFEIKYDGYRCLAETHNGLAHLKSRQGSVMTAWFPEVVRGLLTLKGNHVFDGEIAVLDDLGRSDFNRLQDRAKRRRYLQGMDRVVYVVFDLLVQDGVSIMDKPVIVRKARLQKLLTPAPPFVLYLSHIEGQGVQLYQATVALELEGIVAKKSDSRYVPGDRSEDWVKIKRPGAIPPGRFRRSA